MMSAPARQNGREAFRASPRGSIDPAIARSGFMIIAVLAADVVRRRGIAEPILYARDHVQIRHRGLHHHDVGAFEDVLLHFAERLLDVTRIHLMRAAVAEYRDRPGRIAERTVKRRAGISRRRT